MSFELLYRNEQLPNTSSIVKRSACSTMVRKSLQSLDYIAADGASAFDDLANLLQQYLHLVTVATLERWQRTLKNGKLYLKGDFKVNKALSDQKV